MERSGDGNIERDVRPRQLNCSETHTHTREMVLKSAESVRVPVCEGGTHVDRTRLGLPGIRTTQYGQIMNFEWTCTVLAT